ncbi:DUF6438 domain-containing protein [Lacibacter sediminis]|uniref:DUF6438 domain-containing protein n=1 Tax=Lacibacter sediminis TaxID=2760713 RepID=A0A7G5XJN3_9BACT|nr:DUF6438 domain-containing protein [Lacibacter sediminis]QNA45686.1 hypothetical protein H4075_05655 [Lacibacter sediminis]
MYLHNTNDIKKGKQFILVSLFSMISIISIGQSKAFNRLWVGEFDNYVKIDTNAVWVNFSYSYEGKKYYHTRGYNYKMSNDTLRIFEGGVSNNATYEYLIREWSDEKLILKVLNQNFRLLASEDSIGRTLYFTSQSRIFTDTIRLEKLLFSTTNCYGSCPAMTFQIDNTGLLKFKGEVGAVKQGYYQAKLSKEVLNELLLTLGISDLDKIVDHGQFNIDASTHTIEIHYNNKVMYIKTAFEPLVLEKLLSYLLALPARVDLIEAGSFEFNFSK